MRQIIILLIPFFFYCCQIKPSNNILFKDKGDPLDTFKVRFDGYYNKLDTTIITFDSEAKGKKYNEIYSSNDLVVFNSKKDVYINGGGTKHNGPLTCEYYNKIVNWHKKQKSEIFGNYTIKNDSIYAYVPVTIKTWGMISRIRKFNYRGYIKNRDTILDWKIILPYPKGTSKFIIENNKDLFNPQTLYFVKTEAVKCLQDE